MTWHEIGGQSVITISVGYHQIILEVIQVWMSDEWAVSVRLVGVRGEVVTLRKDRAADREAGKVAALAMARAWVDEAVRGLGGVA